MPNLLSQLTTSERTQLLEELNYMNLEEIRRFCGERGIPYRIVAERDNETVRMDRMSSLMALAKARVWASEGWDVTIIVRDEDELAPAQADRLLLA